MFRLIALAFLVALLAHPTVAHGASTARAASGSLEGDWFLVMRSGDVKPTAGHRLALLALPSEERIGALRSRCSGANISAPALGAPIFRSIAEEFVRAP